jgi:general secretion pathway protein G
MFLVSEDYAMLTHQVTSGALRRGDRLAPRSGFTLVEILIVVILLGVLAAIVIPQFSDASNEAREATLAENLDMVRRQIELFRHHHVGVLPGEGGRDIVEQLTERTDMHGIVAPDGRYGPYMQSFPTNPFTGTSTVEMGTGAPGGGNCGWFYNTETGAFYADDDAHVDM